MLLKDGEQGIRAQTGSRRVGRKVGGEVQSSCGKKAERRVQHTEGGVKDRRTMERSIELSENRRGGKGRGEKGMQLSPNRRETSQGR